MTIFEYRKTNFVCIILALFFFSKLLKADDWNFKLKSKVELRSWTLNSRGIKNSKLLNGASVKLLEGDKIVSQTLSDADGNFEMLIPSKGDYMLMIEYQDHTPKKFAVSTRDVAADKSDQNFKPVINMVGIMMSKPATDIKYLGLDQSRVQIEYEGTVRNLDKKEPEVKRDYNFTSNIYDAEYLVIRKFCTANKLGDMALEKKDYELAKIYYSMASDMLSGEAYPKLQLKKVEEEAKVNKPIASKKGKTGAINGKSKVATNLPNQNIPVTPVKSSEFKSTENGKHGRKIRKTL